MYAESRWEPPTSSASDDPTFSASDDVTEATSDVEKDHTDKPPAAKKKKISDDTDDLKVAHFTDMM